jgi:hypothetical protein
VGVGLLGNFRVGTAQISPDVQHQTRIYEEEEDWACVQRSLLLARRLGAAEPFGVTAGAMSLVW